MNVIKNGIDFHGEITTMIKDINVLKYDYCHQVLCQKSMVHERVHRKRFTQSRKGARIVQVAECRMYFTALIKRNVFASLRLCMRPSSLLLFVLCKLLKHSMLLA